ncbi:unnamed protein product [Prunus armeniaca]
MPSRVMAWAVRPCRRHPLPGATRRPAGPSVPIGCGAPLNRKEVKNNPDTIVSAVRRSFRSFPAPS